MTGASTTNGTPSLHPDVRRHVFAVRLVSCVVAAAGIIAIGHASLSPASVTPIRWPFLLFGACALATGFLILWLYPRWLRKSSRIVASFPPMPGRIILDIESDSDSTTVYATVLDSFDKDNRFAVLTPSWHPEPHVGKPMGVSVYREPGGPPVAFRTPHGMLWRRPWSSAYPGPPRLGR